MKALKRANVYLRFVELSRVRSSSALPSVLPHEERLFGYIARVRRPPGLRFAIVRSYRPCSLPCTLAGAQEKHRPAAGRRKGQTTGGVGAQKAGICLAIGASLAAEASLDAGLDQDRVGQLVRAQVPR